MGSGFTRGRFLKALGALGAAGAYVALVDAGGRELLGRTPKLGSLRVPKTTPLRAPKVWSLPSIAPAQPKGVWDFRSRPDLAPAAAQMMTMTSESGTAPGYLFLALKEGAGEHGPMILDGHGELVWFEKYITARNFRAQRYRGRPVLTWWEGRVPYGHGVGEYVIFDDSYRQVARVHAGDSLEGDLHEFLITPDDTALLTAYEAVPKDLSSVGGPKHGAAWDGIAQEIDLESGEVLFEWRSLEHVGIEESYLAPPEDPHFAFDYFHINSVDVYDEEHLIVSARNTWTVYKIERKTGEIVWRLGGKRSDFEMGEGTRTALQHDARRHEDGTITIFDNGANLAGHDVSRAILLRLDEQEMSATLLSEYASPEGLLSTSQGDAELLPNGNVFVGWGSQPYLSEFSHEGELLLNARFPPDCESYRAFRFPWTGHPTDAPALAAERIDEDRVALYASWNGATEVATWEVIAGPRPNRLEPLGSIPRNGFETAMVAQSHHSCFAVRAKERSGRVLGISAPVDL